MSKIAMVGDKDSIWPFKAFGFELFPTNDNQEAEDALSRAIFGHEDYAVVFVTEDVFNFCTEIIETVREKALPAVIVLPNVKGSQGIGLQQISTAIRTAIGSDIQ